VVYKETAKYPTSAEGDTIGQWYEEQILRCTYVLFKRNNKIFLRMISSEGIGYDEEEMNIGNDNNRTIIIFAYGGFGGEYFIINEEKALEIYDRDDRYITTAKIIK
jgi:hypothetical protein